MDKEVYDRVISVYFVDCVILMILYWLSNGICLLNFNVDCLILSCCMEIDDSGCVVKYEIFDSVIYFDYWMMYYVVN